MRQSENYLLDKETNENVKFFLKKWWFPNTSYNVKPLLTNYTKTRHLNSFEISQFDIDSSHLPLNALVGYQLEINHSKYSSLLYKSLSTTHLKLKKCSHFIKYQIEDKISFGLIDYFIQIECVIYAKVIKVNILSKDFNIALSSFSDIFEYPSEMPIFYEGKIMKECIIINVTSIIRKCIYLQSSLDGKIYFSEFISEIDHN